MRRYAKQTRRVKDSGRGRESWGALRRGCCPMRRRQKASQGHVPLTVHPDIMKVIIHSNELSD